MADDKNTLWAHDRHDDEGMDDAPAPAGGSGKPGSDSEPWDAYRKWLSRRTEIRQNRGPLDPALYTWKGYRSWTEEVKRNWSDRHRSDLDES